MFLSREIDTKLCQNYTKSYLQFQVSAYIVQVSAYTPFHFSFTVPLRLQFIFTKNHKIAGMMVVVHNIHKHHFQYFSTADLSLAVEMPQNGTPAYSTTGQIIHQYTVQQVIDHSPVYSTTDQIIHQYTVQQVISFTSIQYNRLYFSPVYSTTGQIIPQYTIRIPLPRVARN